jgi:uncharacterized repeat protein (TIGR03943 family)
VNRDTQSVLLTLVGGAVVRISVDDTFLRYVRGWMRPALLAAGTVVILLGLLSLWRERRSYSTDTEPGGEHGHVRGPWVAWLLVLPVLAIFLVAPHALGSYTAERTAARVTEPGDGDFEPLPTGDPVTVSLTEYAVRTIWDRGRSLTGRRIRMVGFVSSRPAGGFYLTRIAITCCAADARPVRIAVRDADRSFPVDSWIAVTGTYDGLDPEAGTDRQVPVIRAASVEAVAQPADPYET